jgi:hypothetical protein
MLGNSRFYNQSLRKTVLTFGTIFNDIEIARFAQGGELMDHMKVPLSYAQKEKYINRVFSDPTLTKSILTSLPRMAFSLDNFAYDSTRKQITTLKNANIVNSEYYTQYVPVPYNFFFTLSVFTRNIEDSFQILEQILPFFTPDYTLTVDFIPWLGKSYDVPVILTDVSSSLEYEGEVEETRLVIWNLSFTVKSYLWPPVKGGSGGLIREVDVFMHTPNSNVSIITTPDPPSANVGDGYGYITTITE